MSCNHCNSKFGFFNRESGCAKCGLSLCRNCVPLKWPGVGKVCRLCHRKLTNNSTESASFEPPETFLKRLENPPITIYKQNSPSIDQQLAQRLQKLKTEPTKVTDEEIRQRLAKLKGQSPEINPQNPIFTPNQPKTEQEQVDSLLEQIYSDPALKNDEIALKEDKISALEGDEECSELPWCVLCNENASVRCLDCDGDLYCAVCNLEGHKEWGEMGHRAEPYKPKKLS